MARSSKRKLNREKKQSLRLELKRPIEENMALQKRLKQNSYRELLKRIRRQLPTKQHRAFSRFIHAPGMDSFNDLMSAVIGKPIAIITGSLFALAGVLTGIYLSLANGYSFNYLTLFSFYIFGYAIALLVESLINFFVKINK